MSDRPPDRTAACVDLGGPLPTAGGETGVASSTPATGLSEGAQTPLAGNVTPPRDPVAAYDREEVEDLLDDIVQGLGCIEPGFGDSDYRRAMKAVSRLRVILGVDDA